MKNNLKVLLLVVIITTMLMSTALGAGIKKTIEVAFDSINLTVNGSKVDVPNIVYQGTTYVPLRAAGEMLGKDVGWNQATNTASINDKAVDKPVEIPVSKDGTMVFENDRVKISFIQVTDKGAEFMVENKTDVVLTTQFDTLAFNGISVSDYISSSDDVSPQSKGKISGRFDTSDYRGKIETISGQLQVFDFQNLGSYNMVVKFVNVKVN